MAFRIDIFFVQRGTVDAVCNRSCHWRMGMRGVVLRENQKSVDNVCSRIFCWEVTEREVVRQEIQMIVDSVHNPNFY
jgi:hypothetical protein